jgi:hypothetical protein
MKSEKQKMVSCEIILAMGSSADKRTSIGKVISETIQLYNGNGGFPAKMMCSVNNSAN